MKRRSVSGKPRVDAIILRGGAEQHTATMRQVLTPFYPNIGHAPFWENALRFNRELLRGAHARGGLYHAAC
jgi:hypothetical protein